MPRRLLALGLVLAGAAAVLALQRRGHADGGSQNGGSRRRAAQLRRERERQ